MLPKIKPEILDFINYNSLNKSELAIQIMAKNAISYQSAERWIKNNDANLLRYPNLIILMDCYNLLVENKKQEIKQLPELLTQE
jgi:hypothetical protein